MICENILNRNDPLTDLMKSYGNRAYFCHPLMNLDRLLETLSFGRRSPPSMEEMPSVRQWRELAYPDASLRSSIGEQWRKTVEEARHTRSETSPMEYTVTCKDGSVRHIEFRLAATGNLNAVVFSDVTERKQREHSLREQEERLRAIFESIQDAIYFKDTHLRYTHCNAAGNTVGICGVSRDITEEVNIREQMRQSQNMESVGRRRRPRLQQYAQRHHRVFGDGAGKMWSCLE